MVAFASFFQFGALRGAFGFDGCKTGAITFASPFVSTSCKPLADKSTGFDLTCLAAFAGFAWAGFFSAFAFGATSAVTSLTTVSATLGAGAGFLSAFGFATFATGSAVGSVTITGAA